MTSRLDTTPDRDAHVYGAPLSLFSIFHLNEELAPAYDVRDARSCGSSAPCAGARSTVSISMNADTVPAVVIRHTLTTSTGTFRLFNLAIPMNAKGLSIKRVIIGEEEKEYLFPAKLSTYSTLRPRPATVPGIPQISSMVISGRRDNAVLNIESGLESQFRRAGGAYLAIWNSVQAFAERFNKARNFTIRLSQKLEEGVDSMWPTMNAFVYPFNLFDDFVADGRSAMHLSAGNIELPPLPTSGVPAPVPVTTIFYSKTHRTISLLAGMREEVLYDEARAQASKDTPIYVKMMPIPSPWKRTDEDDDLYGQEVADGMPIEYMAIAQYRDNAANVFPAIGEHCTLTTRNITAKRHIEPHRKGPENIFHIATDLCSRIEEAMGYADRVCSSREKDAIKAQNANILDGHAHAASIETRPVRDKFWSDTYRQEIFPALDPYLDEALVARYTGEDGMPDLIRCACAIADQLKPLSNEDYDGHIIRIREFLQERPLDYVERYIGGIAFHGVRVQPPPGITMHHALIMTKRPVQPDYPKFYKAPYLKLEFPDAGRPRSPSQLSRHAFPDPSRTARGADTSRTFIGKPLNSIECLISTNVNNTSQNNEGAAIDDMAKLRDGTDGAYWYEWTRNFQAFDPARRRDLFAVFPGLNSLLDHPDIPRDMKSDLTNALRNSKTGKVIISGGPASGKTSLLMRIVEAAMSGLYYFRGDSVTPSDIQPLDKDTSNEADSVIELTDGPTTTQGFPDKISPIVPTTSSETASVTVSVPASKPTATPRRRPFFMRKQPPRRVPPPPPPPPRPVFILWVGPSNQIVNDAVQRAVNSGWKAARAYSFSAELKSLLNPAGEDRPLLDVKDLHNETDKLLVSHRNALQQRRKEAMSARNDPLSLSRQAEKLFDSTDRDMALVIEGRRLRVDDPNGYTQKEAAIKAAAAAILQRTALSRTVIFATPVSARMLGTKFKWLPSMIVIDENGRMPEAQMLVAISQWPSTATFICGDDSPVAPVTKQPVRSNGKVIWADRFGSQRWVSFLHRAADNGAIDVALWNNYRSFGNICAWASRALYSGRIVSSREHLALAQAQLDILAELKKSSPNISYPGLFVDVPRSNEAPLDTSFCDNVTSRFALELAIFLSRNVPFTRKSDMALPVGQQRRGDILIATPYAAQKLELDALKLTVPKHELPPNTIDIRTINECASHEAAVVIIDLPCPTAASFMDELHLLTVASTRANFMTIWVGNQRALQGSPRFHDLMEFHKERNAFVIARKEVGKYCKKCEDFGHWKRDCRVVVECKCCPKRGKRTHTGRSCNDTSIKLTGMVAETYPSLDSIERNPLRGCRVETLDESTTHQPITAYTRVHGEQENKSYDGR